MQNGLNCQQLRDQLAAQFDVVCFVDLADLHGRHRNVFDLFYQHYKTEYTAQERLILYTNHKLEQSFIDHIQYAASRIDISNFFILFASPDDLSGQLALANQRYGHDHVSMQNLITSLTDSHPMPPRGYADRSFLCALPFMAVDITQDNSVFPCCKYKYSEGNLDKTSLKQIFDGPQRREIRQQMINGSAPTGCQTCVDIEKLGSTSMRQLMHDKYGAMLDQGLLDEPTIVDVTINPSSVCNFKCRICNPSASSSIRAEEIRMAETALEKNRIKKTFPVHNNVKMQEIFLDPDLTPDFIHILGGEPFLWERLSATLERLIADQKSKTTNLEFNTNGSIFPDYLEKLSVHFKKIEILISIDAVGARFELQRGGQWSMVLDNVKKFAVLNKKTNIVVKIAPTVNIQNLMYLDEVINLADDLGIDIVWTYLEYPAFLCIDNVTAAVKHRIRQMYQDHPILELRKISRRMSQTAAVSGRPFLDYTKKIDQRRKQDFRKFHQEICELMEQPVIRDDILEMNALNPSWSRQYSQSNAQSGPVVSVTED